jgi:AraC-like DNA-binding protein
MADYAVRTPWRTGVRRLLDYLLIYVQEGHCAVTVSGVDYDVPPGQFCLIQPDEPHTLHGYSNTITPFAHLDIFYNSRREESYPTRSLQTDLSDLRDLVQPRLNDIPGIAVPVVFQPADASGFRETMLKMIGTWQQNDALSQIQSQYDALGLILALLQQFSSLASAAIDQPQSLNWVTAYCAFHLSEPISVADLAARAYLSPSHFTAIFRRRFGISPHQYLLHLRIQRAQELLRGSGLSLAQIAEQCGFADVHHFSKTFRRVCDSPPGAYRASARRTG